MFAETFAEFFRHACQSAAILLPFQSSEERLYLEHSFSRSRYLTWVFVATFNCPFLISEVIFLKENLETYEDGVNNAQLARFACGMVAILTSFLLPWLGRRKVSMETLWTLLICAEMAVLLTRPVIIIDNRHMGHASRGSLAELLVVCAFAFLPLRFCVALLVLALSVIGSACASYISGEMMDPLLIGFFGIATLYNVALLEAQSRRNFLASSRVTSVAVQASNQALPREASQEIQVASSDTFQELHVEPSRGRSSRRHRSLPPEQQEGKWATAVKKFRSDGHRRQSGHMIKVSPEPDSVRRGRVSRASRTSVSRVDFSINVVPNNELLGSSLLTPSVSASTLRAGQASATLTDFLSINSVDFQRHHGPPNPRPRSGPEGDAPRLGDQLFPHSRNSLSVSKSSEPSDESPRSPSPEVSANLPLVEVQNAQCQTDILWKDGGWHCTRCSKPPAPLPAGEMKRTPDTRRRSKGQGVSVEAWKKAMSALTHLQGSWRMVYGPENVSPWLEQFMICGTTVCCEDGDRPMEMMEVVHPTLGGGMLLLDKDDMLHRFGKTGQHLMFQRHDVTNLTSLARRMNEENDPEWFAQRVQSGEISLLGDIAEMQDLMDDWDEAERSPSSPSGHQS